MAVDRVRPLKIESISQGGSSDDESITEVTIGQDFLDARGITLQVSGATTASSDASTYVSRPSPGALGFTDTLSGTLTLEQLLTSVSGKPGSHNAVPDIIHYLGGGGPGDAFASGMYRQTVSNGVMPVSVIWFTSAALTTRLYGIVYEYTGLMVSRQIQTLYANNVAVRTVTDSFNYGGNIFAPAITRTWS